MKDAPHRMVRMNGRLYQMMRVTNEDGSVQEFPLPLHLELGLRDIMQIAAGASLFALPFAYSPDAATVAAKLPLANVAALALSSLVVVTLFIYYNNYREHMDTYRTAFFQRVVATYLLSVFIAGLLLTLLGQAPWIGDITLALKRTLIIAFPSSMAAAIGDNLA